MESSQASFEVLRKEIQEQSQKEASDILEHAEKEKNRILQEAKDEADKILFRALKKAQSEGDVIRRRILSGVHLEMKQESLKQRENVISRIMERVEKKLDDYRKQPDYRPYLEKMIFEGLLALDVSRVEIQAGDAENKIMKKQFLASICTKYKKDYGKNVEISLREDTLYEGGVVLEDAQKRLKFDNRFSARIHRMQNDLRLTILKKLESY